jgi:hypothetical protein
MTSVSDPLDLLVPRDPSHFVGLDLGQVNDFAALAALHKQPDGVLHLRALSRKRGRSYPRLVEDVAAFLGRPDMAGAVLAVDMTGVGRPVVDALRVAMPGRAILGITATSGASVTAGGPWCLNIPKKILVSTVLLLLQGRRLVIGSELPLAEMLVKELTRFKVKVTAHANEAFEADQGEHDDLVFALALACWLAENWQGSYTGPLMCSSPGESLTEVTRPETLQEAMKDLGIDPNDDWKDTNNPWRR